MFDLLLPFAQQHTFKASSWGEEARQTLANLHGFSPQALTVLGIHALNHDNFEFFKYCMENGGNIGGLTDSEMESYFKAFNVYSQTFLSQIEPCYNTDVESIQEFIPYYRPYCFRSNPDRLHSFISMGGRVLSPLSRIMFTSKGYRYQPEPISILRLNPYSVNEIPVSAWRKVFDDECFFKNGKPKTAMVLQFHRLVFRHFFTRYQHKPDPSSDAKRHVPDVSDTRHFVECRSLPTSSVVHLFKTPPVTQHAWHSPEEAERVFDLSIDQAHFKSLLQVFNENHQWHHQKGRANGTAIEFVLDNQSFSLNQHHENLLLAAACHTFGLPFDFSMVNPIELEDVLIFEKFMVYEKISGVFSDTGQHLLEVCLFNLMVDRPDLFNMSAEHRQQKANGYLCSFLDSLSLFYPLMFPGVSLEHKPHHLGHQSNLTVLISVFAKICEELKNNFNLMEYSDFGDEIKEVCALFDEHSNPHQLLQEQIKQLQGLQFPPVRSLCEEPDDGSVLFRSPSSLMTDNSRHGANLRYLCLQYAALRSQLLSSMKSVEKSRLQAVFQHLHRLYPDHKITQSFHCMVLQKQVRSVHASSRNFSETSRF